MCGIIGYSGEKPCDMEKIGILFIWNSLARESGHSSGMYTPNNGLRKTLESGPLFIMNNRHEIIPDNLVIGHVRKATVGTKDNVENAHPFMRGDCVLVHNGTLHNYRDLVKKRGLETINYMVDSDALAACIDHDKRAAGVLSEINGGAAVIIHDTKVPDTIHVFRNSQRELWRGVIDGAVYISSEPNALHYIGCTCVKIFKEDIFYTICKGIVKGSSKKIDNKPYTTPIIPTPVNAQTVVRGYHGRFVPASRGDHDNFFPEHRLEAMAIGCNLRAKWGKPANNSAGEYVSLKGANYYFITDISNYKKFKIRVHEDVMMESTYDTLHFMLEDVILPGDLVRVLADIYTKEDKFNKDAYPVIHKGDIIRVRDSGMVGKFTTIAYYGEELEVWKRWVIKLHGDELDAANKNQLLVETPYIQSTAGDDPLLCVRDAIRFPYDEVPEVDAEPVEDSDYSYYIPNKTIFVSKPVEVIPENTVNPWRVTLQDLSAIEMGIDDDTFSLNIPEVPKSDLTKAFEFVRSVEETEEELSSYFTKIDNDLQKVIESLSEGIIDNKVLNKLREIQKYNGNTFDTLFITKGENFEDVVS